MNALMTWRTRRTEAQARRRYARCLRWLAASPSGWDTWLDLLADSAAMISATTADDQAEMWEMRADLVRCVAAANRGRVLIRAGQGLADPWPELWETSEFLPMWHRLALAPDDDAAAAVLDELFKRLMWSSVPAPVANAALVLAQLAGARRSAGRIRSRFIERYNATFDFEAGIDDAYGRAGLVRPDGRSYTHPDVFTIGVAQGWAEAETDPARIDWPARQGAAAIPFQVIDGRPVNPCEKTAVRYGRNEMGFWGEQKMADALVTATTYYGKCRWLLMVERGDGYGWAVPGGHIEPGESGREAALRELTEETALRAPAWGWAVTVMPARYVPDPRASDEAWAVTVPVHVDLGDRTEGLPAVVGRDDATSADWISADSYDGLVTDLERHYGGRVFAAHAGLLAEFLGGAR